MTLSQSDAGLKDVSKFSPASSLRNITDILAWIALLAIVSSLIYSLRFHDFSTPDSFSYLDSAANLAAGHGFRDASGHPEIFRTPGYPLLIAPFIRLGLDIKYLIILQHFLRLLTALGAAILAFKLSKNRMQTLMAGILICLDLPTLEAANTIMSETLFTLVLTAAFWLIWKSTVSSDERWQTSALAGLVTGASILVRPIAIFFWAPAALYFFLVTKKLRSAILWTFLAGFFLLPLLWAARNYQQVHKFTVSNVSAVDILLWRAASVLAYHDAGDFHANLAKRQVELEAQVCDEIKKLRGTDCSKLLPVEKSDYELRLGWKILLDHKGSLLLLSLQGAGRSLFGGDAARLTQIFGVSYNAARAILLSYTIPCFCLCLIGLLQAWRFNKFFFYLALLFLLYFIGVSAGPEGYSRFRVPIMPVYAILAAAGLEYVRRCLSRPQTSRTITP